MTKLILALNVATPEKAKELFRTIGNQVDLYKIGIDLWTQVGPQLVKELVAGGAGVFLDLKFADIPSVVAKAVTAATDLGVKMLTVHTMGGAEMLLAATKAAKNRAKELGIEPPLILGVTVLTSLDRAGLFQITGFSQEVENRVLALSELAQSMGCNGVIASPKEIKVIKKRCGPKFIVVTPGIRLQPGGKDDQARFLTPQEAQMAGADYIVVGRPIYEAKEPLKVIAEIKQQLSLGNI
ncbi:MAG: orotidine-5'-phosphate decarboxylase [candidate division WOR-3 bacterium]